MSPRALAVALAMVACPGAALAQTTGRFDIACRWTQIDAREGRAPTTLAGVEQRFRVDTTRPAYCEDECERIWRIEAVTPDRVTFQGPSGFSATKILEYRRDGSFVWDTEYPADRRTITRRGTCERLRFSGFPADARDNTDQ